MPTFQSACQDSHWFFEIELVEAFGSTVWEIIGGASQRQVDYDEVLSYAGEKYEEELDKVLQDKACWKACEDVWPDNDKLRAKVLRFLRTTYDAALVEATASKASDPTERMEKFVKTWMGQSMQRAWTALEHS